MNVELVRSGVYKADFRDINGRRVRRTINAPNKKAAILIAKRLAKTGVEVTSGVATGTNGMTLKQALTRADLEHFKGTKNRKHVSSTSRTLENTFGADIPLKDIDSEIIQRGIAIWKDEDLSNATINRRLALLSKVFRLALDWKEGGVIVLKHMPTIKKLKEGQGRTRIFSEAEESAALSFFKDMELDIFVCLMDSGMRVSELLGSCNAPLHNAFELLEQRINKGYHAYSEINWVEKKFHIWESKGGRARTVPMSDRVQACLEKYKDTCMPFMEFNPDRVCRQFNRLRKHLKLEGDKGFSAHACRHTFATRMWKLTKDIYLVKKYLGHASITTTERYTHLDDDQLNDSMALFNSVTLKMPEVDTEGYEGRSNTSS